MPPGRGSGALPLPAPPAALLGMVRGIMGLLSYPEVCQLKQKTILCTDTYSCTHADQLKY